MVIMHISDLHFGIPDKTKSPYIANRRMVLESFFESFSNIPVEWRPDILVITGDIGYFGIESDYKLAEDFFERFLALEGQKVTKNDIIICPGNHDVFIPPDRRQELRLIKDDLSNKNKVEELTKDTAKASKYKFKNYIKFLKKLGIPPLKNNAKDVGDSLKYLYGYRKIKDISFIVLNSEWDFFGKNDKDAVGCLRLGEDLVADALEELNKDYDDNQPIVALFHRPIDPNIHISEHCDYDDRLTNVEKRLNTSIDIILNGHVHIGTVSSKHLRATSFSCGTLHSTDCDKPGFWLFKINTGKQDEQIYQLKKYKWDIPSVKFNNGSWVPDLEDPYNGKELSWGKNNGTLVYLTTSKILNDLTDLIKEVKSGKLSREKALKRIEGTMSGQIVSYAKSLFESSLKDMEKQNASLPIEESSSISKDYEMQKELKLPGREILERPDSEKKGE